MVEMPVDLNRLAYIRQSHLSHIPVTLWGKISRQFLDSYGWNNLNNRVDVNMWDFYNACTDVLWHEEKPTMASFEHNQSITDKLLGAMA